MGSGAFFLFDAIDYRLVLKGLKAGQSHNIEIRVSNQDFIAGGPIFPYRGGFRLGAIKKQTDEDGIKEAVELAKDADGLYTPTRYLTYC